jgi:hypothetical protein
MSLPRDTTPTLRYTPTVLESLQENSKKVALACTYLANTELLSHIQLFQLDLAKNRPAVDESLAGIREDTYNLRRIGALAEDIGRISRADRKAIDNTLHTAQALETRVAILVGDIIAKARKNNLFIGDTPEAIDLSYGGDPACI